MMDRDSPPNLPRKRGFSTGKWQHQGKYKGEHGKSGNGRATAQDWFDETKPHPGPPKEKPAWNVWVAPRAKTPERRLSNPQPASNHTTNASDDSPTANGPQIHPDRLRLWSEEKSEVPNGISSIVDPWPPTSLREDREVDRKCNGTHEKSNLPQDTGHASTSDERSRSSEADRSQLPPLITERRQTDQAHSDHRPSPASGRGTPGSTAMDVDDFSAFGRRSSNRTAGAATLTRQTTTSLPPPPPPDINTEDSQAKMNYLLKTLGQFTSAITSLASTNVQQELAEKKVVRQKTELDRWRKHHSSFTSLAEEHEREMAKAKSASYLVDMRLKEHETVRDEAMQAMAATMLANGNVAAVSDPGEDKKVRRMQSEITDLRSEINENLDRLRSIQYEPSHVISLARTQSEGFKDLKRAVHDLEKRAITKQNLYELDKHYVSRNSFVEMEGRLNDCAHEWSKIESSLAQNQSNKLTEQVEKLKEQMDNLNSLKVAVNRIEESLEKMDGTLNAQEHTLQVLNHAVLGEEANDDQSLFDHIAKIAQDVNMFRGTLKTFNEEIGTLTEDAHKQATRVETLELENSTRDKPSASPTAAELRTTLQSVTSNVTALSEDLAQLKAEQETKDELVGQESERLDTSLQALESQVGSIRSDFEAAVSRIDVGLSELQSRQVPAVPVNTTPTPQVLPDASARSDDPLTKDLAGTLQEHRRALKQHYDKLQAVEAFQISLSQRFDNLTTDRLAQNMVHQMQKMWPNAAEVKIELDQIKELEGQLKSDVDSLKTALEVLRRRVGMQDLSVTVNEHKDQLVALAHKCENLTDATASSARALQMTIHSLDSDVELRVKELNQDAQKAKEFFAEVSEQLRLDIEKVNERLSLMEHTNIDELASLHGQVVELKNRCQGGSQVQEQDNLLSNIIVDSDGTGRISNDQNLSTPNKGSTTELEGVLQPETKKMRRLKLITKKEKLKRKRISSSDTEDGDKSKRRGEEA